jgi:hypothetical protein
LTVAGAGSLGMPVRHILQARGTDSGISQALVCDDPRLIDVAEQLLGGPVVPECPEGVLYFFEAGWHADDGTGSARSATASSRRSAALTGAATSCGGTGSAARARIPAAPVIARMRQAGVLDLPGVLEGW